MTARHSDSRLTRLRRDHRVRKYRREVPQLRDGGPVRFRLYPKRASRLYLVVQVWPCLRDMREYMRATYPGNGSYRRTLGMCSSFKVVAYPKGRRSRTRPIFAEVNLCAANLTQRIVTHEFFHATLAYARRAGIDLGEPCRDVAGTLVVDAEEQLSEAHGNLCNDFVVRAQKLGLYDADVSSTPWKPWRKSA